MVGISGGGGGGGGGGGYKYVQDAQPADPSEGEEWYDTGANAVFVFDGSVWKEIGINKLSKLSDTVVRNSEFVALGVDGDADNGDLSDFKYFPSSVSADATDEVHEMTIPDHPNGFGFRLYLTGFNGDLVLESIELIDSNDNTLVTDSSVSLDTFLEYPSLDNQVKTIRAVVSNTNDYERTFRLNEWEILLKKTYVSNT